MRTGKVYASIRVVAAIGAAIVMALSGTLVSATAANAAAEECYKVGDPTYAELRSMIADMATKGELTQSDAALLSCDPRRASDRITYTVKTETSPGTLASGCKRSSNWIITFNIWGQEAGGHNQSLNWCWNNETRKVSDWTGGCGGYVTNWGKAHLWSFDSCSQNDFIGYTLDGSYPGGVHHYTKGKFENSAPHAPPFHLGLSIWGHYRGTCDTKYDDTYRNYC